MGCASRDSSNQVFILDFKSKNELIVIDKIGILVDDYEAVGNIEVELLALQCFHFNGCVGVYHRALALSQLQPVGRTSDHSDYLANEGRHCLVDLNHSTKAIIRGLVPKSSGGERAF